MRRFSALAANKTYWAAGGRDLAPSTARDLPDTFKPGPDRSEKSKEFKTWMNLFFIKQGGYYITKKGYTKFGKDVDAELTAEERIVRTREKVATLIAEGKAEELYDQGMIRRVGHIDWGNEDNRRAVMRKFVEMIGKPDLISKLHFYEYGLSKLLMYYKGSVRKALEEAGVESKAN